MMKKETLQTELKEAMRAGDERRRDVLRMLLAAIKQKEVDSGQTLDEEELRAVLARQAKQRREAIADAEQAGRDELAQAERAELNIIEEYLPPQLSREEIRTRAQGVIDELGAGDVQDMGQVMGRLMPQLKGQADGSEVSDVVRKLLQ